MFDAVARHYDRMNKFMSLGMDQDWRRFLIEGLEVGRSVRPSVRFEARPSPRRSDDRPPTRTVGTNATPPNPRNTHPQLRATDRVLDLATGTADVAILAAEELRRKGLTPSEEEKAGAPPRVLGIDPSAGMLALGREKVAAKGLGGVVTLELGDAQALGGVPSGSVDKIAMSFGVRNVEDRPAALREMARVLRQRPESRVGILEFQLPRSGVLKYVGDFMVRYGAPAIGALLTGLKEEYVHLRRSILEFPPQEGFAQLMREAGLEVLSVKETGFGVVALFLARPSDEAIAAAAAAAAAAGAAGGEGSGAAAV